MAVSDDDYDDEAGSDDNNFIADDVDVARELEESKRRMKKKLKKEKRRHKEESDPEQQLDEEDLELINENKSRPRKLKKIGGAIHDSDDEQIDSTTIKKEEFDKKRAIKKQIFEKRGESTAADEDAHQTLKDKFVTEDIDDLFGTTQDLEIAEKDIPEKLQIKIGDRLNPSSEEIEKEAEWIFNIIIESLTIAGDQQFAQKISEIKTKIAKVLNLFRCDNCDIPYITRYRMNELIPELEPKDVWRIFNLDVEYGKFQIQKKQCEDFFQKLSEFGNANQMDHYKNQIFYIKNQRDLNDFVPLMNFYKSYYQKELTSVMSNTGKKLPVQKKQFVFSARQRKLDEFSRKCMLNPIQLVENIQEDKQLHKPNQPQDKGPTDMAKEYMENDNQEALEIIKDMCVYTAIEMQSQPDIRRGFKKHVHDYGLIATEPTDKGLKELDLFHPSYRVKRIQKKLKDMQDDLFLDILQNESLGLIKYQIIIEDNIDESGANQIGNKFFQKMFDYFRFPEDTTKWRFLRREIFEIFSAQNTEANKGSKSFLVSIIEEVKNELKENAEKFVIDQCSSKYSEMMSTGYFKINDEIKKVVKHNRAIEEDIIPQRERLNVLGAIMYPLDNRNFQTTIAVVDQYGELVAHKDFLYLIPPRKPREGQEQRPGLEEEIRKHSIDKKEFQDILREHNVDLIVISADCLEAKRLKKALSEFANLKICQDQMNEGEDQDMNQDDDSAKEAFVIWGRSEVPKLFAASHYSQKLLKNHPFILKKAICLARFEQDPMNEILNLWSPIMSENQTLHLNLHPLQKHINQARLVENMEQTNIQFVNRVGIDINLLVDHDHLQNQLQFLSGLGPRKAQRYIQKLKSLGKPLYTRNEIYENKILKKNCFVSSLGFTKVRVPPEKRPDDMQANILDQTRIHLRNYDHVYKLVTDCLYENQPDIEKYKQLQAVNQIIKNPEKLKEFAMGEYKENIKKVDKQGIGYIFDQIIEDLMHPFMDFREDKTIVRTPNDQKFTSKELFYNLADESERTFKAGIIVSATVMRIYDARENAGARILCKLENGLDANIGDQDADFFPGSESSVDIGSIVTGRIDMIKFGDKFANDENYTIVLKCKQSHLRRHDLYIEKLDLGDINIPEEDKVNMNFKVQEEQAQNQQKQLIQKRKIQHQRFQNISSTTAIANLKKEDNGEFYFRPSSKGQDHLTLTWKFYESNIVHIDITELEKAIGANIGSKLRIGDDFYENLQEIVERYIIPCNRSLREILQHPKFIKTSNVEELKKSIETEKEEDASRIPYKFTVLDKYPQYVVLAYMPKKELVKEFIKVKPRGYFFHQQYHYPFQNMINWFKQEFRTKEYQRFVRKTGSPQLIAGVQYNPSNQPMEGDVKNEPAKDNWGSNVKNEREAWGVDNVTMQSPARPAGRACYKCGDEGHISRECPQGGGGGGGAGGSRACFKCGEEGHMSRECPTGGGGGGGGSNRACYKCGEEGHISRDCPTGGGGGSKSRGPMKCYNCQQEGHGSRDCPEPKSDNPPYKRQRNDEGGAWQNKPQNDNSNWGGNAGGGAWDSNSQPAGGNAWGENKDSQPADGNAWGEKKDSQPSGEAWGDKKASQSSEAWGNQPAQASQGGGGW